MLKIFLAHAKEDEALVTDLYYRLKEKGYEPWLDKEDLLPGQVWRAEIPKAIRSSQIVVACLSNRSVRKQGYVQDEFRMALKTYASKPPGSIYMIPVRLDDCVIPEIRQEEYGLNLRDIQWLNFFELDGFDKLITALEYAKGCSYTTGTTDVPINDSFVSGSQPTLGTFDVEENPPMNLSGNSLLVANSFVADSFTESASSTREAPTDNISSELETSSFNMSNHIKDIRSEQGRDARLNIAVIGKTGVGKSSLINYIFGENIRRTGVGKPITRRGFEREEIDIQDVPATLFDSWGLEVGNSDEWLRLLKQELSVRSTQVSSQEWFHIVIYCISASSSRVEEFELRIIREFLKEKYKLIVVLTKSDIASRSDIEILSGTISTNIKELSIDCIPMCCQTKELMTGTTSTFGRETLLNCMHSIFWDAVTCRLPERCTNVLKDMVDKWSLSQKSFVEKNIDFDSRARGYGIEARDVIAHLEQESNKLIYELVSDSVAEVLEDEVQKVISIYSNFSTLISSRTDTIQSAIEVAPDGIKYSPWLKSARLLTRSPMLTSSAIGIASVIAAGIFVPTVVSAFSIVGIVLFPVALLANTGYSRYLKEKLKKDIEAFSAALKSQIDLLEPAFSDEIKNIFNQQTPEDRKNCE